MIKFLSGVLTGVAVTIGLNWGIYAWLMHTYGKNGEAVTNGEG